MRQELTFAKLFLATAIAASSPWAAATNVDLSVNPAEISDNPNPLKDRQLKSGMGLALHHSLLNLSLDYKFQAPVGEAGEAREDGRTQLVGASLRSSRLDKLLGVKTRLKANSTLRHGGDAYQHKINPGFSRSLLDLATLDVNYIYQLSKASDRAAEKQQQGYSLGLKGKLYDGRLSWSGAYSSEQTFRDKLLHIQSSETLRFQSRYEFAPDLQLQLSSSVREFTDFKKKSQERSAETLYGAGIRWTPAASYAVDVKFNHKDLTKTGDTGMFGSGRVSWFPNDHLVFSLDYGDHLMSGERGVLLSTRLDLDYF